MDVDNILASLGVDARIVHHEVRDHILHADIRDISSAQPRLVALFYLNHLPRSVSLLHQRFLELEFNVFGRYDILGLTNLLLIALRRLIRGILLTLALSSIFLIEDVP